MQKVHFSTTPMGRGAVSTIRVEVRFERRRPFGGIPVEIAHFVRTGHGAHAAAYAAGVIYHYQPLIVLISRFDRAYLGAGRVVARAYMGRGTSITSTLVLGYSPSMNGRTSFHRIARPRCGLFWSGDGGVILHAAGSRAALAGKAFFQIDDHSPTWHIRPPGFLACRYARGWG